MRRSNKGVTTIIGAILLIGFVILLFSQYMFTVAPQIATPAEYEATHHIYDDMNRLRGTIDSAADTGRSGTLQLNTKVDYPIGSLESSPLMYNYETESASVSLNNYNNRDSAFLDGKTTASYNSNRFNTTFKSSNERRLFDEVVGFEHGVPYRSDDNSDILSNQPIVNGKTITIYLIQTNLGISSGAYDDYWSVESTPFNKTQVNPNGSVMTLQMDTRASESSWLQILQDEFDENGGYITNVQYTSNSNSINEVEIVFDGSVDYTVYIARATIDSNY